MPTNHTDGDFVCISSNSNILTITSNGYWSAVGIGEAIITVGVGNIATNITVTVVEPAISVEIDNGDFTTTNRLSGTLVATVLPTNHTDTITWISSNTNKLVIDSNGRYTAVSPGEVDVVVIVGSVTDRVRVTILEPANNIVIKGGDFITTNGLSGMIMTTVLPSNHTDGDISWSSDNPAVVELSNSNGVNITYSALSNGVATITAGIGDISTNIIIRVKGLGINITVSNYITTSGSIFYGVSNFIFSDRVQAVVHYTTNTSIYTNIFLSNIYNSNYVETNFLSNNLMVVTNTVTTTNIMAIDTNSYVRISNITTYALTNYTKRNKESQIFPSGNMRFFCHLSICHESLYECSIREFFCYKY